MSESILTITEAAGQKLRTVRVGDRTATDSAVRLRVLENGAAFRYEFSFVDLASADPSDTMIESDDLHVLVDAESLPRLTGSTLDFVDDLSGSGFKVENPNKTHLASNPLSERVQRVLDEQINPGVAQHGGTVSLVDIEDTRIYVQFGGGCQGCGQADVTLKQGIVVAIKEAVPEVTEVLDATDHTSGANPYY